MKPQAGVVYGHGETGLYTNGVRTLGSVREGRRSPRDHRIWKNVHKD
jgi:hypothetical protein